MTERDSNFQSDYHTLYCGWVMGQAAKHGIPVTPVVDADGNYLPELELRLADRQTNEVVVTITLVIPEPPDGWELP